MLPDFDGESRIELVELARIFSNFAALRQPRTAELVRGARKHGEDRVVDGGPELCEQRDERLRLKWVDKEAVNDRYDFLLREPF
jgi:salicylate hydroxylase